MYSGEIQPFVLTTLFLENCSRVDVFIDFDESSTVIEDILPN
jgi:hypothetical protein